MNAIAVPSPKPRVQLRQPMRNDGAAVWHLVGETGALERNSAYAYLLLCTHFRDTCLVAEQDARLLGCVLSYAPPREPQNAFVWQVGVARAARGHGLGSRLLDALLELPAYRAVRFLCASVAPENQASRALFSGFARRHGVAFSEEPFLDADDFPAGHAAEPLLKIGPLPASPSPERDHEHH